MLSSGGLVRHYPILAKSRTLKYFNQVDNVKIEQVML
jgi:hypothetical protein